MEEVSNSESSHFENRPRTREEIISALRQPPEQSRIKSRQGGGGKSFRYLATHDVIEDLNIAFGEDGWTDKGDVTPIDEAATMWRAKVEIVANIGSPKLIAHSDVGFGAVQGRFGPDAVETAMKGAYSDALKRAARKFGERFGNKLYEESSGGQYSGNVSSQAPQQYPQQRPQQQPQQRNAYPGQQSPDYDANFGFADGEGDTFQDNYRGQFNEQDSNAPRAAPPCPNCGGEMWDNRPGKANGKFKPNSPDFRCKDQNCKDEKNFTTAIWEETRR